MKPLLPCLLLALVAPLAAAQSPSPMSREELAGCAERIQRLRAESPRLLARNAELDQRLEHIQAERRRLDAESAGLDRGDFERGLAIRARREQLNDEARALNAEVFRLREDIQAISAVKAEYDRVCAGRPLDRRDTATLTESQQAALRAGLADIQVPFLAPGLPPVPGFEGR